MDGGLVDQSYDGLSALARTDSSFYKLRLISLSSAGKCFIFIRLFDILEPINYHYK